MDNIPSLLVYVGAEHYTVGDVLREYATDGVSKRIPLNGVIDGLIPGQSLILVAHPKAILKVTAPGLTLFNLAGDLFDDDALPGITTLDELYALADDLNTEFWSYSALEPDDFIPENMLFLASALGDYPGKSKLEDKYSIVYCGGIIGYSYFTGYQLVVPNGKEELPALWQDKLGGMIDSGTVELVHVNYVEDEE